MFDNIKTAAKTNKLYVKIITFIMLITIMTILSISIFSYYNSRLSVQSQISDSSLKYLNQTVNAMEIVMSHISESCKQLALGTELREFERIDKGEYYEYIINNENMNSEISILIYNYIKNKENVIDRINTLEMSSDFIDSVYFYDKEKNLVITSRGLQFEFEEFYDKDWYRLLINTKLSPIIMETQRISDEEGQYKDVVKVIYRSYNKQGNAFVINIDADYIYENIISKLNVKDNNGFFIVSESGKILISSSKKELYEDINIIPYIKQSLDNEHGTFLRKYKKDEFLVTYNISEKLKWKFVSVINMNEYYKGINAIKLVIMVSIIILLLLLVPTLYFSSRNIYKPIYSILQFIQSNNQQNSKSSKFMELGEMKLITNTLQEAFSEREKLKSMLNDSMPAYKEKYILSLLGSDNIRIEDIKERFEFFNIEIGISDIIVLLVGIDKQLQASNFERDSMINLKILKTIRNNISEYNSYVTHIDDNKFLIIMNWKDQKMSRIFSLAQRIKHEINNTVKVDCTIGVSSCKKTILDLKKAYKEAKDALRFRIVTGEDQIIYIEDIRIDNPQKVEYPKQKEISINNYIMMGDKENACKVMKEFLKYIVLQNKNVDYNQTQQIFLQLLSSIINTAYSAGIDIMDIYKKNINLYMLVMEKENLGDIINVFNDIISNVSDRTRGVFKQKANKYVKQVMEIVEENCGYSITLNSIADKLNVNADYLGKVVKEHTGKTFLEYLTSVRMERSKMLLVSTNKKIKEICEEIGYSNSNYFIKLFKGLTGVTPGEFRRTNTI